MEIPIEIVMWFLGILFLLLSTIIGFMFKVLTNNTDAINNISLYIAKDEERSLFEEKDCSTRHAYVNSKLKQHTDKLEEHEKRINKIEK